MVLEHASMTDFCGIPLVSLRENSITELNLEQKGIGEPGAIVLSKLLPSAVALTSLKCAAAMLSVWFCQRPLTRKQTLSRSITKKANTLQQPTSLTSPDMPSLCFSYHCRVPW